MLDYILSKMVLLIFLMLLVAAFLLVRESVDSFFLQQSAKGVGNELAERLRGLVTSYASMKEAKTYALPPVINAGGRRYEYEVNCAHAEDSSSGKTVYYVVFSLIVEGKPVSYSTVAFTPPRGTTRVSIECKGFPASSSYLSGARRYIRMERTLTTGALILRICAVSKPGGSC